jgi:hypothetical protein
MKYNKELNEKTMDGRLFFHAVLWTNFRMDGENI